MMEKDDPNKDAVLPAECGIVKDYFVAAMKALPAVLGVEAKLIEPELIICYIRACATLRGR